jgi:hypothetical protein
MATVYSSEPQIVKNIPRNVKRIKTRLKIEKEKQPGSRINWKDPRNFAVLVLAAFGQSDKAIQKKTGHSSARIAYRLKLFHLNKVRWEFRNNKGPFVKRVMNEHTPYVSGVMEDKVKRKLLK